MRKSMIMVNRTLSEKGGQGLSFTFINSCIAVPALLDKYGCYVVDTSDIISAYQLIAEPLEDALLVNANRHPNWSFQPYEIVMLSKGDT